MTFREKSAWVTMISILLVSGFYFLHVPWSLTPASSSGLIHGLIGCIIALIVIEVIAHIVLAVHSPKDAMTPRDERERLIDLKATRVAAYVYAVGSLMAVSLIHLGGNKFAVAYGVLFAFVVAEVIRHAAQIFYFRRGV